MDKLGIFMLLSAAGTNALANSFLKVAFSGNTSLFSGGIFSGVWKVATNPYAVLGATLFGVSFLFFAAALGRVNLSLAYPFMSGLAFLLIFLTSVLFFKEQITTWGIVGVFSILFGIILLSTKG